MAQRWKRRPEGSNWGDFGPDDRLGRMNLVTPERRRAALAEAREGLVFNLSLPLDVGPGIAPFRKPPRLSATERGGKPFYNFCLCTEHAGLTDVICDDRVVMDLQYSTQWDSFTHVGSLFDADGDGEAEIVYYNGYGPSETVGGSELGIEHMSATGVQGRGVMIDLRRHFGDERTLVGYDKLMRVMEVDRITVETGDLVCFHTGLAQRTLDMRPNIDTDTLKKICSVIDGTDQRLLQWVTDTGLSALIADNYAVEDRRPEPPPSYEGAILTLHEHCLFKLGVHLGEIWHLTPLAAWLHAHGRSRFLLTAPPLRMTGAVGAPMCPVATV